MTEGGNGTEPHFKEVEEGLERVSLGGNDGAKGDCD